MIISALAGPVVEFILEAPPQNAGFRAWRILNRVCLAQNGMVVVAGKFSSRDRRANNDKQFRRKDLEWLEYLHVASHGCCASWAYSRWVRAGSWSIRLNYLWPVTVLAVVCSYFG